MTDVTPPTEAGNAGPLSLEQWRLLDWRFLLPVVQPRNLGYGGAVDRESLAALRLLDPGAGRIDSDGGPPGPTFDVVLLSSPDLQLLEAAAQRMQPGGWMCAEFRRSLSGSTRPRTLYGWRRAFVRNGFRDVSVQWHAPGLRHPSRMVPLASGSAVRDTLARHQAIPFGAVKELIGRLALALRVFELVIPEGTVTGRRPGSRLP
ncbi:hypothetical protein R5O87_15585 [Arthrobacter globiformis]|uniref:hypothetical protein n=1 Tax=Arthrobacter globiformis TaxID=1665 RepID=UPI00397A65FC